MLWFSKKNKFFNSKYVFFNEIERSIYAEKKLNNDTKKEIDTFLLNQFRKMDVKILCSDANRILNLSRITDF